MNKNLTLFEDCDLEQAIEKKFKKYILEVDDAIEAYGFKRTSYIDYAEDSIFKVQNSTKKNFKEHGSSILFTNLLESSLNNVVDNIINYTIEDTLIRNKNYPSDKLDKKASNLHEDLKFLNERLLNSFKTI